METLMSGICRASDGIDRVARWIAIGGLIVMLVAIAIQVVGRYIFQAPPIWTDELARYAMVWTGLLGASVAFKAGYDPVLFKPAAGRSKSAQILFRLMQSAAVVTFLAPVLYYSIFSLNGDPARGFLGRAMGRTMETLGLPMFVVAIAVPITAAIVLLHLLARWAVSNDEEI
jgi:TRAP-type C4-dicarboxylate transport system permease small subunit